MSQYRSNRPSRPTGAGYGMGSRTSVPPKSPAAARPGPTGTSSTGSRASVPTASARTGYSYGGSRTYTPPPTGSGPRRSSGGGKWIVLAVVVVVIAAIVAGVFLLGNKQPEPVTNHTSVVKQRTDAPVHSSTPAATPTPTTVPLPDSQPQAELYRVYAPELRWYVQQMTTDEKRLFAVLYDGIAAVETNVSVPSMQFTKHQLDRVLTALRNDCPELVHFNREAIVSYSTMADYVVSVTFAYTYPNAEENLRVIQQVLEEARGLIKGISTSSTLETEHKLYSQIVQRAVYDKEFEHCANADGVFLYGKAKCSGYAAALNLACRLNNVPCIYVTGEATNDDGTAGHAWNYVQIDGEWYVCDATWDRSTYESYQEYPEPIRSFLHYFNVTEQEIKKTHQLDRQDRLAGWALPSCTATRYSFWNALGVCTTVDQNNWQNVLIQQLNEASKGTRQQIVLRVEDQKQYEKIAASYHERVAEWIDVTKNWCGYTHSTPDTSQLIILCDFRWTEDNPFRNSGMHVRFLDVGDADAAIVSCGGHVMLIDGGTEKSGSSKLYSYLLNNGITYVDAIVVSHPHSDHAGGLSGALAYEGCSFGTLYSSVLSSDNKSFNTLLEQATRRGLQPVVPDIGTQFQLGDARVTFLSPEAHKSYENVNNKSLVVRVDYGETSFLFTGDAMENAELDMLRSAVDLDVDILKVAHHGADSSSGMDFLRAVSPKIAVISCGADNADHPGTETMNRLQQTAGLVLRTDEVGEITIFTDGDKLTYIQEK